MAKQNQTTQPAPAAEKQEYFFPSPVPMTIEASSREEAESIYQEKVNPK